MDAADLECLVYSRRGGNINVHFILIITYRLLLVHATCPIPVDCSSSVRHAPSITLRSPSSTSVNPGGQYTLDSVVRSLLVISVPERYTDIPGGTKMD